MNISDLVDTERDWGLTLGPFERQWLLNQPHVPERVRHGERRTAWLTEQGVRVLRISARDVLNPRERHFVFSTILAAARGL